MKIWLKVDTTDVGEAPTYRAELLHELDGSSFPRALKKGDIEEINGRRLRYLKRHGDDGFLFEDE